MNNQEALSSNCPLILVPKSTKACFKRRATQLC